jgi:hypothetical protein
MKRTLILLLSLIAGIGLSGALRAQPLRITYDGAVGQLRMSGPPDAQVLLQASSDMTRWVDLQQVSLATESVTVPLESILDHLQFFRASLALEPPAQPSNASVSWQDIGELSLSWIDNSEDEDEFVIQLSLNGESFVEVERVPAGITETTFARMAPGSTAVFSVQAVNAAGASPALVFPLVYMPPFAAAPASVELRLGTESSLQIEWTAVPGAIKYVINKSTEGEDYLDWEEIDATRVQVVDSDVSRGLAYRYVVSACSESGCSGETASRTLRIPNQIGPPVLFNPADQAVELDYRVMLSWGSVVEADGYDWEVYEGDTKVAGFGLSYEGPHRGLSVTVALDFGKSYRWRARARVLLQNNPWSEFWTFSTTQQPTPSLISPLDGESGLGVSLILDWMSVPDADGYDWELYSGAQQIAGMGISYSGPYRSTSVRVAIDYDSTYRWRARGRVLPQNNRWSPFWTFSTRSVPTTGLVSPANGASGVGTSVILDWISVGEANGYDWELYEGSTKVAGFGISYSGPYPNTSVTVNLNYSTAYQWRARARVLPQNNPWTSPWSFITRDPPPVPAPTEVNATILSGTSARVCWVNNAGTVDRFEIWQQADGGGLEFGENVQPDHSCAVRDGLASNHTYCFYIRAVKDGRYSAFSDPDCTLVRVQPPSDITASGVSRGAIRVGWRNHAGTVDRFEIWQKRDGQANFVFGENVPPDRNNAIRDGLSPGIRYCFKVLAVQDGVKSLLSDDQACAHAPQ